MHVPASDMLDFHPGAADRVPGSLYPAVECSFTPVLLTSFEFKFSRPQGQIKQDKTCGFPGGWVA